MVSYDAEFAKYYDLIYSFKDYKDESNKIRQLIEKNKKSKEKLLLDVACGTGKHLKHLRKWYDCTGLDLTPEMLALARKRLPGIKLVQGNMRKFNLHMKFDAMICMFSAIGHILSNKDLELTYRTFSKHLKDGGALIVEPWLTKKVYRVGLPWMVNYDSPNLKISRMNVSRRKGNLADLDFHLMVAQKDSDVMHRSFRFNLMLFNRADHFRILHKVGMEPKYVRGFGRGLIVAVKKSVQR